MRLLIGAMGLALLVLALSCVQSTRRAGLWSPATLFMYLLVLLPSLALATATLTGNRHVGADVFSAYTSTLSGPAVKVELLASPTLILVAAISVLRNCREGLVLGGAAAVALLLALVASLASAMTGGPLLTGNRLASFAVLGAAVVLSPGAGAVVGSGLGVMTVGALDGIAVLVRPDLAMPLCHLTGCGPLGFLLVGAADNQNAMALLLVLGLPYVYWGLGRQGRYASVILLTFILVSGGLTASIAAVATMLCLRASSCTTQTLRRWAERAAVLIATAAVAMMVVLPFAGLSPEALTGRGRLWSVALGQVRSRTFAGAGPDAWRQLVDAGVIPRAGGYSPHNEMLEVLVVTGLLGAALFVTMLALLLRGAGVQRAPLLVFLLPALICGIAERPWAVGRLDWLAWSLPAVLLALPRAPRPEPQRSRSASTRGQHRPCSQSGPSDAQGRVTSRREPVTAPQPGDARVAVRSHS